MKKIISSLAIAAAITFGFANTSTAQTPEDSIAIADSIAAVEAAAIADQAAAEAANAG